MESGLLSLGALPGRGLLSVGFKADLPKLDLHSCAPSYVCARAQHIQLCVYVHASAHADMYRCVPVEDILRDGPVLSLE